MLKPSCPTIKVTREEANALFSERLRALDDFCLRVFGDRLSPNLRPRSVRAVLSVHERSPDGCVLASVRCSDSAIRRRYIRRIRLVPSKAYSGDRRIELRRVSA